MKVGGAKQQREKRGSALLLVLWVIIILGMLILGLASLVEQGANRVSTSETDLQARALALTGVALGFQPDILREDPLLHQNPSADRSLEVEISGEGGRINLNELIRSGHPEIVERLFVLWGVPPSSAQQAVAGLIAWGDNSALELSAQGTPDQPIHRPFRTLQQVSRVLGMEVVMRQHPNWQDSITLWSDGRLNVNEASEEVLAAFFNVTPARANAFTQFRNGPDGRLGTADDQLTEESQVFCQKMGLSEVAYNRLSYLTCFRDAVRRVTSMAMVGGQTYSITAIAELGKKPWQYFLWSEN